MIAEKAVWMQVFCAALTGVLSGNKPEIDDEIDNPFADAAFDAVAFATAVADEALEWELEPKQWRDRKRVQEVSE